MDEDWNLGTSFWSEMFLWFFSPLYHAAQNHILSSHTYFLFLLLPNHKQYNMIINLRGMDWHYFGALLFHLTDFSRPTVF